MEARPHLETDELHTEPGVEVRFLGPDGAEGFTRLVRRCYGDSYDAAWVYDADEVGGRIADGRFVSCVAEDHDGSLLCHAGLSRVSVTDPVAESGQAVTMPAARGHHLFQAVKARLAVWSGDAGLYGLFSEVTTAHPYSERANIDLGAHETGFLLGWIPKTVSNDAARGDAARRSVALFYLRTNDGHERPVYAPRRHHDVVRGIVDRCGLRGRVTDAEEVPPAARVPAPGTRLHPEVRVDHNIAILTVVAPGEDLVAVVDEARAAHVAAGIDVVYVDLALEDPRTEVVGGHLGEAGFGFAGVFPNRHVDGDVLRLQSLGPDTRARLDRASIATASPAGDALLDYVLADLDG